MATHTHTHTRTQARTRTHSQLTCVCAYARERTHFEPRARQDSTVGHAAGPRTDAEPADPDHIPVANLVRHGGGVVAPAAHDLDARTQTHLPAPAPRCQAQHGDRDDGKGPGGAARGVRAWWVPCPRCRPRGPSGSAL